MKVKGVYKIFTGRIFHNRFGLYMKDRYVFGSGRVRFVGEQIGAVVAFTPGGFKSAVALVKVEYEPLPAVLNQMDALQSDAPLLHPEVENYPRVPWFYPQAGTNIAHWRKTRKGDLGKGFAKADVILEDTYSVPVMHIVHWRPI